MRNTTKRLAATKKERKGEDIPRSIRENLQRMGVDVEVKRVALMESQVVEWGLPPAPVKLGDSRSKEWDGLGQVELDAVEPKKLQKLCQDAIDEHFDQTLYKSLQAVESEERELYQGKLREFIDELLDED